MAFSKFCICGTEWENIYTRCQQTKTSGGLILYQKEDNSPVSQRFFFTETLSKSNKYGNVVKIRENHRYWRQNRYLLKQQTTRKHPKLSKTIWNHPKFLATNQKLPGLAIISLKPPETSNNQPQNAFGWFHHLKLWNYTQQSSLNRWRTMNILIFIFTVIADMIIIITA